MSHVLCILTSVLAMFLAFVVDQQRHRLKELLQREKRSRYGYKSRPYKRPAPEVKPDQDVGDVGCPVTLNVEGGEGG